MNSYFTLISKLKLSLISILMIVLSFTCFAQQNVGLLATSTHSGGGVSASGYGPELYNDGQLHTCAITGTYTWGWVTTNGWIEYTWTTPQSFDKVVFYKANRPMTICTLQYWNGSAFVDFYNYSSTTTCEDSITFSTVSTTRLRFNNVSGSSNPNHREIRVIKSSQPGIDVEMVRVDTPQTWGIGNNNLAVTYRNNRNDTIKWVDLGYRLNWNTPVLVNNYYATVKPGMSQPYSFATKVNIPAKGNYSLRVWATAPNDSFPDNVPSNDTLILSICTAMGGTYKIGGTGADYATFNAAVTDLLKCGVYAPVTFEVANGTYTERIVIPAVKGASATNTITFKGTSKTAATLQYNASSTTDMHTILLNGADYLTFENMTIQGSNTNYAVGVCLTNAADYNTFKNCNFIVPNTATTSCIPVMASGSTTSYSGAGNCANYNTWVDCEISGGYIGASFYGPSSTVMIIGNTFLRCKFYNNYYYGVWAYYTRLLTIKNCSIDLISNTSFTTTSSYGIYTYYGQKHNYDGNVIKAGQYAAYTGYMNYQSTGDSSMFANNIITEFSNTSYQIGLYAYYYNYNWRIYNNVIKVSASTANNYNYAALVFYYYTNAAKIYNNILISTGNHLLISFYPNPATMCYIDYNDYIYPTGSNNFMFYNATYATTLNAWKSITNNLNPGHDANSWENLDPYFVSATDFHLSSSYPPVYGFTVPLFSDVDGDTRCPYATTIGADETKYPVQKPKSVFVADDTICHSSPVTFFNAADPKAKQGYFWYFNGTFVGNTFNWSKTFPVGTGYDTISLVTRNCGGTDTFTKYIFVDNPSKRPKADFISDLNEVEVMYPVQFSDLSANCPSSWTWKIKPATIQHPQLGLVATYTYILPTTPASQNPYISFDFPGTYEISLVVKNSVGADSITKIKYITVKPLQWMCLFVPIETSRSINGFVYDDGGPTSDYANNKNCDLVLTPCAHQLSLKFKEFNVASGDYLRVYEGTNASGTPLWNVNAYGTSGLTGTMTNPDFKTELTSKTGKMYIQWQTNASGVAPGFNAEWQGTTGNFTKPVASFICPDTICLGVATNFLNTSSSLNDAAFEWYFTDPYFAESFDKNPSFSFLFDGTYTVKLKVIDCGGESEVTKDVVVVAPFTAPKPDFTASNTKPVKALDIVTFSGIASGCADYWEWSISPASYSAISGYNKTQFPAVRFNDTGCYDVKLIAGFKGMKDSITKPCFIKVIEYCKPTVQVLTQDLGITKVTLSDISNSTPIGKTEYSDYTQSASTFLDVEATYSITVERSSNFNPVDRKVWIDWNIDGDFDDQGELVGHQQNSTALSWTTSFKVPWNAPLGHTRMRISAVMGGYVNNPCGSRLFGEVEDYKVIVRPDGTPPVITLTGADTVFLPQCTANYTDSGATAQDNIDGNITSKLAVNNNVDLKKAGTYYVKYNVSDLAGNKAKEVARVVVIEKDTIKPVLTLNNGEQLLWEAGNTWVDPGFVVNDDCSGMDTVVVSGNVDVNKFGKYNITYTATDKAANSIIKTREVTVADTTDPVANLLGYSVYYIEVFTSFSDPGLKITDNFCYDNNLKITGSVNTNKTGTYTITYEVYDCAGNGPVVLNRIVNVYDSAAPTLSTLPYIKGDLITMEVLTDVKNYLPALVYSDNYDAKNDLTVKEFGNFFTEFPSGIPNKLGTYKVEYEISDKSNNITYTYFDIKIVDSKKPVIALKGQQIIQICRFKEVSAADMEATVTDNFYTNITINKTGTYFTDYLTNFTEGLFTIRYNAVDGSNNVAKEVVRYIDVIYDPIKCNVGISENSDPVVYVYPNPANSLLNVVVEIPGAEFFNIEFMNALGQVMLTQQNIKASENIYTFDVSNFNAGVYLIKISSDNQTIIKQVVIQK